ncbi:amidase [Microbispora sp. ATCC PTA-5024]|uniref:amidase n=1 Tax=Microbispora sp. ATCC PTA-5024 TaxID=316330 RepID=UPI0003DBF471|nr:amidase [Microbispora sp. ATCC PTA-5024]ETK31682.1 amidase [Microbispora sp. ATCC PTA-5024]
METHEYARYDAAGLRDLIRAGEVTAAEVETAARAALEWADARLNGLAMPVFDRALDHADDGPLSGVPFLIKDHGPVAEGVPFTIGSRALRGVVARHDTDVMKRFRAAGLAVLGVTTVPEMAVDFATESERYGVTRNPWDTGLGAGGSSGGAAALVAAGAVPVAHASDGAGSIRIPASCCGLVGLKPSRGRVTSGPDMGEPMFGMAYEFALTRTVRDAALMLDAVEGPGVGDKYTAPPPLRPYASEPGADPGALRVAVTTGSWSGGGVDPEVAAAAVAAGAVLEGMGHRVEAGGPAVDWDDVLRAMLAQAVAVASTMLLAPRKPDPASLEGRTRRLLQEAREASALDLIEGFHAQNRVSRAMGAFFTGCDLLVTPTLARLPAPHGTLIHGEEPAVEERLRAIFDFAPFTMPFNVAGQPAISLPLGWSAGGLPIGVQLVAPYGREDLLLRVAARLEEALPWRDRTPAVSLAAGGRHPEDAERSLR